MPKIEVREGTGKRLDEIIDFIYKTTTDWPDTERFAFYHKFTTRFRTDMKKLADKFAVPKEDK